MSRKLDKVQREYEERKIRPWRKRQGKNGCDLSGYQAKLEQDTNHARNLSPSLKGCYADPLEWAMEEHSEKLPLRLDDPGAFESTHYYQNPRDPGAWPKVIKVVTLCVSGHARSFAMKPGESLTDFPPSALKP